MTATVYAGPHYGARHDVLDRQGNVLTVQWKRSDPFRVHACDAELEPVREPDRKSDSLDQTKGNAS